jgi:hypothetical protein
MCTLMDLRMLQLIGVLFSTIPIVFILIIFMPNLTSILSTYLTRVEVINKFLRQDFQRAKYKIFTKSQIRPQQSITLRNSQFNSKV